MAKQAKKLKHLHSSKVLFEQVVQERNLLPGMIVSFKYNKPKVWDRQPLLFFMYKDGDKLDGINLNYLTESMVQKMFKLIQSLAPVWEENIIGANLPYLRAQLNTPRAISHTTAQYLYTTVLHRDKMYINAYRSYKLEIITGLKVINYELDILTDMETKKAASRMLKRKPLKQKLGKTKEEEEKMGKRTSQQPEHLDKEMKKRGRDV